MSYGSIDLNDYILTACHLSLRLTLLLTSEIERAAVFVNAQEVDLAHLDLVLLGEYSGR